MKLSSSFKEGRALPNSDCAHCQHYDKAKMSCAAFQGAIPAAILMGHKRHRAVLPAQVKSWTFTPFLNTEKWIDHFSPINQ
ncbi:hypothetical protein [Persicobacter psychrovividus]|uniref:Uncharacterized protein n=1 Tax=Persicobacter psychrovividus TaxID=387638 RepID=A0ABN6LBD1_9BACT|nr:hypothetical protein PEPS_27640 [Persicobacter psychrovividus]